jgi:GMP synthase PP-ATPase subunit
LPQIGRKPGCDRSERELFKDEVRALGRELGMPPDLVNRHPFPGPGLAIRIPGDITREKLDLLREVDAFYLDEIRKVAARIINRVTYDITSKPPGTIEWE